MKTHFCSWRFRCLLICVFAAVTLRAQNLNSVVTVDSGENAAEAFSHAGKFMVRRTGGTNFSQLVFYELFGSASNGVDYQQLSGTVQMPAGATAVPLNVIPIDDSLIEGTETVVVRIVPSPLDCATCGYNIGYPDGWGIPIFDNDLEGTNHPPYIELNSPQDGAGFKAPADVALRAYAYDMDDQFLVQVEFFEGTNRLGFGTFGTDPYRPDFALTWSNVPPGRYTVTARATDSLGGSTLSVPAQITVIDPRNGLYQIDSGSYHACCGFAGNDLGYALPTENQSFVRLEIDPENNSATMAFLGADAQTVFTVIPCPPGPAIPFSFTHGLVFPDRIVFQVDPGPVSYWNYTARTSPTQLRIDGVLGLTRLPCADVPDKYGHSNVVATLVPSQPLIEAVERQGDLVQFHISAEAPYDYFVEYSESLAPQNWLALTNFRAKLGTLLATVSDPMSNNAARFYRIRKQHCFCRNEP